MPDSLDLDKLQSLCDAATPGPWDSTDEWFCALVAGSSDPDEWAPVIYAVSNYRHDPATGEMIDATETLDVADVDAKFIVAARTAMPQLIARVRSMTERIKSLVCTTHLDDGDCGDDCAVCKAERLAGEVERKTLALQNVRALTARIAIRGDVRDGELAALLRFCKEGGVEARIIRGEGS